MAEEYNKSQDRGYEGKAGEYEEGSGARAAECGEIKDRGLFDFLGKKEAEKPQEEVIVTEFEKVKVSDHEAPHPHHHEPESYKVEQEEDKEKKHGSLLEKLHRSDSSSSSSSDEEEGEGGEKKKKKKEKKGLKEKICGDHDQKVEDTAVPVEKIYEEPTHEEKKEEEKKGFLEKIKEKLPGQQKKPEEIPASYDDQQCHAQHAEPAEPAGVGCEPKEKKGILEKIKEKIPGYHPKTEEEKEAIKEKEKEKETSSY
ncbi:hypothetical protein GCM10023197_26020 [Gordonia humi]|uniref:Dehydrin n=2 Tax=Prunus persica TaxID=3760 RepID=M5XNV8_PRUPE|nr:phosphoprotein ECPP44 [Prunus persica]ONI32249.1 hypothetical protein PRUPE_1G356400 [Prunus persica]